MTENGIESAASTVEDLASKGESGIPTSTPKAPASPFLAILSRMKYIERWALMRSSRPENLSEHSLEVALITHMLAVIGNVRFSRRLNAERGALIALFHDASEIITGDLPTPVKYHDVGIRDAYKAVEHGAETSLLETLPEDLRPAFENIFWGDVYTDNPDECYLRRLVKAADKISALLKCIDEARSGNREFERAEASCRAIVEKSAEELPEVGVFVREFLPSFGKTLDELLPGDAR